MVYARKYRPRTFSQVVGQQHISRTLLNSIRSGRLAHALIFNGPRGVGKTSMARILAKSLNCLQPDDGEPCGQCDNCRSIDHGSFLDVMEIDAASNRGIDAIKSLIEEVHYAPSTGMVKVYIIDEFHMLTKEAFNAFLKTLEEPPEHTIFVLATTDLHKVNQTILSRCQRHDFRRIAPSEMTQALGDILRQEQVEFEPDALKLIAQNSEGCMRDAESILDRVVSYSGDHIISADVMELLGIAGNDLLISIFTALQQQDLSRILEALQQAGQRGTDMQPLTAQLMQMCRAIYLARIGVEQRDLDSMTRSALQELGSSFDVTQIDIMYSILRECFVEMKHSPFPQYDLEFALFKCTQLAPSVEVDRLLAAMEATPNQHQELPEDPGLPPQPSPATQKKTPEPASHQELTDISRLQQQLVKELAQEQPHVAALLHNSQLRRGDSDESYVLMVPPHQREFFTEEKQQTLQKNLSALVQKPSRLVLRSDATSTSLAAQESQLQEQRSEQLRQQLLQDEMYQDIVRRFQGSLHSFRLLKPGDVGDQA
nr:DNA polymerase III subunit gamma/tau [Desulfurispira natronophila]